MFFVLFKEYVYAMVCVEYVDNSKGHVTLPRKFHRRDEHWKVFEQASGGERARGRETVRRLTNEQE